MGRDLDIDTRQAFASALEWWRDAGVDTLVEDDARDWLAPPAVRRAAEAASAAVASAPAEVLPATLEEFIAWRMSDAAPEADWLTPRVAPSGPAGGLMILTDVPETGDAEAGALMSGAPGKLLERMLAAIGVARDSVHLASMAFARPLTGRIPAQQEARLADLARHHIGLVAPNRLLLLGDAPKRAFAGTSGSASGNDGRDINQSVRSLEIVASYSPRFLMDTPAAKAEAWKHLLLLSRGSSQ